ncbi:MAG TPA: GAF domain-containing sensor histidine kinase [Actinomycetales bacterium]|nr:GAF domain-containing sensor histidine kinase [Actinomycetales bacterium]
MNGRRTGARAVAAVQVVLACVVLSGLWFVPAHLGGSPDDRVAVVLLTVVLTGLMLIGATLAGRRPDAPLAWVLLATSCVTQLSLAAGVWAALALDQGWPFVSVPVWLTTWLWVSLPLGLVVVLLRLPDGRPAGHAWVRVERVAVALSATLALLCALVPGGEGTVGGVPNPLGVAALAPLTPAVDGLALLLALLLLAGLVSLSLRFRRAGPVERQQLRWVGLGAGLLVASVLSTTVLGLWWVTEVVGALAFVACLAVAVLRHRLWDLGLVLRRGLTYAVLTGLLLALYLGLALVLRSLLPADPELLPGLVTTAVVALAALPLRRLVGHEIDRMLFGDGGDALEVVRNLGRRLEQTPADSPIAGALSELGSSLRLPHLVVTLADGTVEARHGAPLATDLSLPLSHAGELVGRLEVSRRHPAEELHPRDVALLTDVAAHLGVAVRAVSLRTDLRRSHERLLGARTEERQRLQRDLHDGLGPVLGAAGMRVGAARNLIAAGAGAGRVDDVLSYVGADVDSAVEEVRRILAGLRPTTLDEVGLLAALQDHVRGWAGGLAVELDVPDRLPPLDPVTEATAYRIALEGLRNAERHSGGRRAVVRLAVDDRRLTVEVSDDGVGLDAQAPAGVGLLSMRSRAEQLGGRLEVTAAHARGAVVRGVLPLQATS